MCPRERDGWRSSTGTQTFERWQLEAPIMWPAFDCPTTRTITRASSVSFWQDQRILSRRLQRLGLSWPSSAGNHTSYTKEAKETLIINNLFICTLLSINNACSRHWPLNSVNINRWDNRTFWASLPRIKWQDRHSENRLYDTLDPVTKAWNFRCRSCHLTRTY